MSNDEGMLHFKQYIDADLFFEYNQFNKPCKVGISQHRVSPYVNNNEIQANLLSNKVKLSQQ